MAKQSIEVEGIAIILYQQKGEDFLSITDIARKINPENPSYLIANWLRNKDTIEFLGVWEMLHNQDFNLVESDKIKSEAGTNRFVLSMTRWVNDTQAIGIRSKAGRYGGTYAHSDIALEFGLWISAEFKVYLIKEFQRLKEEESNRHQLEWNVSRTLAKVNYRIHTDAIKEKLIPEKLPKSKIQLVYASEADLLNVALFGLTAKEWRSQNPDREGNIRDHATIEQLVVLSNMESINAMLIQQGLPQPDRLKQLNELAIQQIKSLLKSPATKQLMK